MSETHYSKVSMNLTDCDLDNLGFLSERMNTEPDAQTVSRALQILRELMEAMDSGSKLLFEEPSGELQKIYFKL